MNPRILILSASVGCGHTRAAQAIQAAVLEMQPHAIVEHVDVLQMAHRLFRRVYSQGYFDLVEKAPHLVGHLYDSLDQQPRSWQRAMEQFRICIQQLCLGPLCELLTSKRWNLAINTHFLPAEIIAGLRRAGRISFPQVTVTTDFQTHRLWHNDACEHYFTATEEGRARLAALGVCDENISAVGIPIQPTFSNRLDALECRRRLGLSMDRPIVLQMSGGLGIKRIQQIHESILDVKMPLHVVVVTGRSAQALPLLQQMSCPSRHVCTLLGFTHAIDQYMAAADIIVSKPGGLTSSEALASGTPMIIVDPIPGQEAANANYLLENGAALKANHPSSLPLKVQSLLSEPPRLRKMRAACLRLARPRAPYAVAEHALKMLDATSEMRGSRKASANPGDYATASNSTWSGGGPAEVYRDGADGLQAAADAKRDQADEEGRAWHAVAGAGDRLAD